MSKLIPFGWYGGKYSHLGWLLPLLPPTVHYCEPFGGSMAVLLNRPPSPVETYNDIDQELVTFFRVLRDNRERLIELIGLTPFSRRELAEACEVDKSLPDLERARRFYVRARQTRTGLAQTSSEGRWATCKYTSRAGMSGAVSRWLGAVEDLPAIAERLLRVQIEDRSFETVLEQYQGADTLFYVDPPYMHGTRGDPKAYKFELTDSDHRRLSSILNHIEGKVALSGYDAPEMKKLYPADRWLRISEGQKTNHSTKGVREEHLWVNYKL